MNEDEKLLNEMHKLRKNNKNFQTIKKIVGEERLCEFFNTLYPKFTRAEIETITGIPDSTLERWFEQLNIPFIAHHLQSKAYPGEDDTEIVVSKDGKIFKAVTIKMTEELAYLIGFALGDGSVQQYQVEVFNKNQELREILFNCLKPYGTITEEERENGLWRLRLSNGVIANLIKDDKGVREDTLNYIFNNDALAKKFIAAFWDAEGSVLYQKEKNYFNLYLYNSNEMVLGKIVNFLNKKGIKFSVHTRKTRDKNYFFNNRTITSKKILHRINIHKASWLHWINEIGIHLNHSRKKEMVKKISKYIGGN